MFGARIWMGRYIRDLILFIHNKQRMLTNKQSQLTVGCSRVEKFTRNVKYTRNERYSCDEECSRVIITSV